MNQIYISNKILFSGFLDTREKDMLKETIFLLIIFLISIVIICHLSHYYLIGEKFENDNSTRQSWKPDILVDLKKLVKIMKLAKVI